MDLLDALIEPVKTQSLEIARDDYHVPLLLLIKDDTLRRVALPSAVHPRDALPLVLKKWNPDAYLTLFEGRILTGKNDEGFLKGVLEDFKQGDIADNPDHPSVLALTAVVKGGTVRLSMAEATREDFPREFGEWEDIHGDLDGSMVILDW